MFKITQRQFTGHLSCTGRVGGVQILDGYFALDGVGCPEYALSRGLEILWSQVQVLVGPPNSKGTYWRHRLQFVPVTSLTPQAQTDWARVPGDNCPYRSTPDRSP